MTVTLRKELEKLLVDFLDDEEYGTDLYVGKIISEFEQLINAKINDLNFMINNIKKDDTFKEKRAETLDALGNKRIALEELLERVKT